MKSSTRTTPRKRRKKWSRLEWLLLLAPLLVIGGLAAMNFAPQIKRSFQEWRDYGNHQPYAVFYPQTKNSGGDLAFYPVVFSPDGKYIAAAEYGTTRFNIGNHGVGVWDVSSRQRVSFWPIAGNHTFVNVLKFVSPSVLDVGLSNLANLSKVQNKGERRDVRSGKLLASQKVHVKSEVPPGTLFSVSPFQPYKFSEPRAERLGDTNLSIKLFTSKHPIKVESSFLTSADKTFAIQWMAQLYDAQGRKLRKPFALLKYFDFWSSHGASGSSMQFCSSPNGKTLLIKPRITAFYADGVNYNQDIQEWLETFDITTGQSLWKRVLSTQRATNLLRAASFSPNSDVTALLIDKYQYQGGVSQGGNVELRNTRTGAIVRQFSVSPSVQSLSINAYMQFSPNEKLLAVPQNDRLELWDVSDFN